MTQEQETVVAIYRNRFKGQSDYRDAVWKLLIGGFFDRYIPANGAVLDLGSGYGEFINNVSARLRYAIDGNPDARQMLKSGVTFFNQDSSLPWPLESNSLDLVFSSNFFEHLPTKASLQASLTEAFRCLKPGGRLVALGPNIKYVRGAYWDFWDHHLPLTEVSLGEVLKLIGFRIENSVDRFLPYTMSDGRTFPLVCLRVYLQFSLIWKCFGKQFLIVARK
jgi:SAM-dependent methyltransferase